jgi:hypothetical protein
MSDTPENTRSETPEQPAPPRPAFVELARLEQLSDGRARLIHPAWLDARPTEYRLGPPRRPLRVDPCWVIVDGRIELVEVSLVLDDPRRQRPQ